MRPFIQQPVLPTFNPPETDQAMEYLSDIDWNLIAELDPNRIRRNHDGQSLKEFLEAYQNFNIYPSDIKCFHHPLTPRLFMLLQVSIDFLLHMNHKYQKQIEENEGKYSKLFKKYNVLKESFGKAKKLIETLRGDIHTCPICSRRFKGKSYLDMHMENKHANMIPVWNMLKAQVPLQEPQNVDELVKEIQELKNAQIKTQAKIEEVTITQKSNQPQTVRVPTQYIENTPESDAPKAVGIVRKNPKNPFNCIQSPNIPPSDSNAVSDIVSENPSINYVPAPNDVIRGKTRRDSFEKPRQQPEKPQKKRVIKLDDEISSPSSSAPKQQKPHKVAPKPQIVPKKPEQCKSKSNDLELSEPEIDELPIKAQNTNISPSSEDSSDTENNIAPPSPPIKTGGTSAINKARNFLKRDKEEKPDADEMEARIAAAQRRIREKMREIHESDSDTDSYSKEPGEIPAEMPKPPKRVLPPPPESSSLQESEGEIDENSYDDDNNDPFIVDDSSEMPSDVKSNSETSMQITSSKNAFIIGSSSKDAFHVQSSKSDFHVDTSEDINDKPSKNREDDPYYISSSLMESQTQSIMQKEMIPKSKKEITKTNNKATPAPKKKTYDFTFDSEEEKSKPNPRETQQKSINPPINNMHYDKSDREKFDVDDELESTTNSKMATVKSQDTFFEPENSPKNLRGVEISSSFLDESSTLLAEKAKLLPKQKSPPKQRSPPRRGPPCRFLFDAEDLLGDDVPPPPQMTIQRHNFEFNDGFGQSVFDDEDDGDDYVPRPAGISRRANMY